jgi:hypothetical protein
MLYHENLSNQITPYDDSLPLSPCIVRWSLSLSDLYVSPYDWPSPNDILDAPNLPSIDYGPLKELAEAYLANLTSASLRCALSSEARAT